MPTSPSATYGVPQIVPAFNVDDAFAEQLPVQIAASQTIVAGTVLGQVTSDGTYVAYVHTAMDGSEKAVGILEYDVTTDSDGNITNWSDLTGAKASTAPMFTSGTFYAGDLTGYDSYAETMQGMKKIMTLTAP